jgi:alcohol dehydrogenase
MTGFSFSTTKTIIHEIGCLAQLGDFCTQLGIQHPLIVTDPGILALNLHQGAITALEAKGLSPRLFSEVVADPPDTIVLDAVSLAQTQGVDGIIGLGGGSSMDVAKLVAVLAKGTQTLDQIYGVGNIRGGRLPLIQIPTTAGTGSEVTPIAIVTTGKTTKQGVVSPQLLPDIALLDAELTLGLPPHVTAATGVDAMVHAIEAYTSKIKKNPYSDMLAKEALRLLSKHLLTAVHDGNNKEARSQMLYGAMLAGQAFANAPVAAVHALAYPLGGQYHVSHGLSNALVLPHILRFNLPEASEHYTELASTLAPITEGKFPPTAQGLIDCMVDLTQQSGLPTTLRELNIPMSVIPALAEDAMLQTRLLVNNPRALTLDDALSIYQSAY